MTVANKPKHPRYKPGMVYAIPLEDGSFGLAQAGEPMFTHIVYVALFLDRFTAAPETLPPLDDVRLVALTATWRKNLNKGTWLPLGVAPQTQRLLGHPTKGLAEGGFVGARHFDAGLLAEFLSAYHGLLPWNVMFDPDYYEKILAAGAPRSKAIYLLGEAERTEYRQRVFGAKA